MAVSGNCENGPLSPMGWATGPLWPPVAQATGNRGLFVIFFLRTGPWRGTWCRGAGRPPTGDMGGLSPPTVDRGSALFKPPLPSHPSFHSLKF